MNLNWLYGPKIDPYPYGLSMGLSNMAPRSVTLDLDTVRELRNLAISELKKKGFEDAEIEFKFRTLDGTYETVAEEDLVKLSPVDRGRLIIEGHFGPAQDGYVQISFVRKERPVLTVSRAGDYGEWRSVQNTLAQKIVDEGTPRIAWNRLAGPATFLPLVLLVASWLVIESTTPRLGGAVHLFGWLLIAFALGATVVAARWVRVRSQAKSPGHRILMESREQTSARRADKKADLRVGVIVALATLVVGTLLGWLTGVVTLPI